MASEDHLQVPPRPAPARPRFARVSLQTAQFVCRAHESSIVGSQPEAHVEGGVEPRINGQALFAASLRRQACAPCEEISPVLLLVRRLDEAVQIPEARAVQRPGGVLEAKHQVRFSEPLALHSVDVLQVDISAGAIEGGRESLRIRMVLREIKERSLVHAL